MDLSTVHVGVHKRKKKKRVGRGVGSGHGKTGTRGSKGQYASAGAKMFSPLFEGGQMQLFRRIPKRGFSHASWDKHFLVVNVGDLDRIFADGACGWWKPAARMAMRPSSVVTGRYASAAGCSSP